MDDKKTINKVFYTEKKILKEKKFFTFNYNNKKIEMNTKNMYIFKLPVSFMHQKNIHCAKINANTFISFKVIFYGGEIGRAIIVLDKGTKLTPHSMINKCHLEIKR